MKTKTMMVALATLLIGSLCFWACQKDEFQSGKPDTTEHIELKTGQVDPDCNTYCINPEEPAYFEKTDQQIIYWGGSQNNAHSKTVDIVYYNTLDAFILKIKSSEDIANLLVDDISVKEFSIPLPADTWYELSFPLPYGWEVCDDFNFQFSVIGNGPPAVFDVDYHLIGECVYYTLELAVNPEGSGSVTGAGEYIAGEQISIAAAANFLLNWKFVNWTGDTDHLDDPASAITYVTMPEQSISLTAIFEQIEIIYGDGATDIDGNEYITVIIGEQEWMAENLRVSRYNNGDDITTGLSRNEWQFNWQNEVAAYAIYDHNEVDGINSPEEMVEIYGKLYNWYVVDDPRGLCPQGWSVPSAADWRELVNYVVDQGFPNTNVINGAGNALKSCLQVGSPLDDCNTSEHPRWNILPSQGADHYGFDAFGFSALPGGQRGSFYVELGTLGFWWSSTLSEYFPYNPHRMYMRNLNGFVYENIGYSKTYGYSVRCVRD
ncbi:MAG: hypothetical protein K0B37_04225 [Bacteroidales bacterium]|nr:hypothetical protein [Bacteroidales bacterium]